MCVAYMAQPSFLVGSAASSNQGVLCPQPINQTNWTSCVSLERRPYLRPEPLMVGWRIRQVTNAAHRQALGRACPCTTCRCCSARRRATSVRREGNQLSLSCVVIGRCEQTTTFLGLARLDAGRGRRRRLREPLADVGLLP